MQFFRPPNAEPHHYTEIQGGYPLVFREGNINIVHHNYPAGDGMLVRTHNPLESYGTAILNTSDGPRTFQAALLRQFHGEPCERASRVQGGKGYERR